jgi:PAS domain S-box-containing protein
MAPTVADRSAAYLAAIVSSSDDAIIGKDLNGIVTSWNRAAELMFGYTADEALGQSIRLIIPADRQDEEDQVLRRIRAGESVEHFETERVRKDGSLIPISLSVSPIRDSKGHIVGASKIARDISERKRGEAVLAAAEVSREGLRQRLMTLVAASGKLFGSPRVSDVVSSALSLAPDLVAADAYVIWRLQKGKGWQPLGFDGVSTHFAHLTRAHGVSELQNLKPLAVEDVSTWSVGAARRKEFAEEGITSLLVVPMLLHSRREGVFVFYHRMPHRYSDVDVKTASALGNLTAAAMTNAELFEEHQRLVRASVLADVLRRISTSLNYEELVLDIANLSVPRIADWCAVDLVGPDGRLERLAAAHADDAMVAMVYELRERLPRLEFTPEGPASVAASGGSIFVPEITDKMLVAAAHGDAEQLHVLRALGTASYMCVPVRGRHGVMGEMVFACGQSGRRFEEDDLALVHELARRTGVAVENAQAYQESQRANRLKDTFLATLSHELRTPLNAILGYARMLRTSVVPDDKRAHALETLERNAVTLSQMINDVLDVSRVAAGKLALAMQPVSLRKLVRECVDSIGPSAADKGLDLQMIANGDALDIDGDRRRLQQVFSNLLSNAIKFTPRGGRIRVTASGDQSSATVEVRDSGIGIPPAFRDKIFQPFQQVSVRPSGESGGLGLGLAIVRQIVALHHGTVTIESEGEGKGSTFIVRLPRHRAESTGDR